MNFFHGVGEKFVALFEWGMNCGSNKQPTECPCEEVTFHNFFSKKIIFLQKKPEKPKTPTEAALDDIVEEHDADVIEKQQL